MDAPAILIGELSRRSGCHIETIRYYERIGLLPAPPRRGRYRSYEPEDVARLGFVRRSRELGFTLDQVRALLALASRAAPPCAEAHALATAHLADIRARIADLGRMERALAAAVAACDAGDGSTCPIIDSLSGEPPAGRCAATDPAATA